ncbi:MAG: DUF3211 domain-containing protein [Candidatus Aramenus sp.]|jgi:hypothetical protein|nr:DUF3211 domain-containing protein [Candidatus Aramenus sp.]
MTTVYREFKTSHECDAVLSIMKDPRFLIKNLFPPVKEVELRGTVGFVATGKFMLQGFQMSGNVYSSPSSVTYVLTMNDKRDSGGKLVISCFDGNVKVKFEYEGWFDRLSAPFIRSWFDSFSRGFDEKIRLERISRKI